MVPLRVEERVGIIGIRFRDPPCYLLVGSRTYIEEAVLGQILFDKQQLTAHVICIHPVRDQISRAQTEAAVIPDEDVFGSSLPIRHEVPAIR